MAGLALGVTDVFPGAEFFIGKISIMAAIAFLEIFFWRTIIAGITDAILIYIMMTCTAVTEFFLMGSMRENRRFFAVCIQGNFRRSLVKFCKAD